MAPEQFWPTDNIQSDKKKSAKSGIWVKTMGPDPVILKVLFCGALVGRNTRNNRPSCG